MSNYSTLNTEKVCVGGVDLVNRHQLSNNQDRELQRFIDANDHLMHWVDEPKPEPPRQKREHFSQYRERSRAMSSEPQPWDCYSSTENLIKNDSRPQEAFNEADLLRHPRSPSVDHANYTTDFPGLENSVDNSYLYEFAEKMRSNESLNRQPHIRPGRPIFSNQSSGQQKQYSDSLQSGHSLQQHPSFNRFAPTSATPAASSGHSMGYHGGSVVRPQSTTQSDYGFIGDRPSKYNHGSANSVKRKGVSWLDERARSLSPTSHSAPMRRSPRMERNEHNQVQFRYRTQSADSTPASIVPATQTRRFLPLDPGMQALFEEAVELSCRRVDRLSPRGGNKPAPKTPPSPSPAIKKKSEFRKESNSPKSSIHSDGCSETNELIKQSSDDEPSDAGEVETNSKRSKMQAAKHIWKVVVQKMLEPTSTPPPKPRRQIRKAGTNQNRSNVAKRPPVRKAASQTSLKPKVLSKKSPMRGVSSSSSNPDTTSAKTSTSVVAKGQQRQSRPLERGNAALKSQVAKSAKSTEATPTHSQDADQQPAELSGPLSYSTQATSDRTARSASGSSIPSNGKPNDEPAIDFHRLGPAHYKLWHDKKNECYCRSLHRVFEKNKLTQPEDVCQGMAKLEYNHPHVGICPNREPISNLLRRLAFSLDEAPSAESQSLQRRFRAPSGSSMANGVASQLTPRKTSEPWEQPSQPRHWRDLGYLPPPGQRPTIQARRSNVASNSSSQNYNSKL